VAIWQLVYLIRLGDGTGMKGATYATLCASFLAAPFFSYTYPVAIGPIFGVVLVQNIIQWKGESKTPEKIRTILKQWIPLFICTFSITVFYIQDVAQLTKDGDMHAYWSHLMMNNGFDVMAFFGNIFHMLAQAGSGFLFWWLFGILCTAAFVCGIYTSFAGLRKPGNDLVLLYGTLLLLFIIALHAVGKMPLGEPRLNAFAIPAIAILLIHFMEQMKGAKSIGKAVPILSFILFAGLIGNIFSTIAASFTDSKYALRMAIYHAAEHAISEAQQKNIPILVTPGVANPYEKTRNLPFDNTVPGDWVLMTFPAYKVSAAIPVYGIQDTAGLAGYLHRLPDGIKEAMVVDGPQYRIVKVPD